MKPSWPLDARGREGGKKGERERESGRGKYIHLVINKEGKAR